MNYFNMIIEISLWSLLWTIFIGISVRIFPFTIEHDYPLEVRKVANIQKPTKNHRRNGILFGTFGLIILLGLLVVFALIHFNKQSSFMDILKYLWIICFAWNVVDLVVVDWILICLFSFRLLVLPKTENCKANKDFKFHFIGFLKGCVAMTIIAFVISGISYGIIRFLN